MCACTNHEHISSSLNSLSVQNKATDVKEEND